jgi:hypothetical protein
MNCRGGHALIWLKNNTYSIARHTGPTPLKTTLFDSPINMGMDNDKDSREDSRQFISVYFSRY